MSSTVTMVLERWTESSLMVTTTWLTVGLPWFSFLLMCTENSWKALRQSDTRLYSHMPGNWNTSPSNVLKCWLPQVLQMVLTWFRTGNDIDRMQTVNGVCCCRNCRSFKDFLNSHIYIWIVKKRERKRELFNLKTFGQFKALTLPGLDFDERQNKETQPHASPPHGCHGGLSVCRPASNVRLLLTSLYRDAALFFPTSHPLSVMKMMMFYCRDMCWVENVSRLWQVLTIPTASLSLQWAKMFALGFRIPDYQP